MKKVVFLGSKPIGLFCLNYLLEKSKELEVEVIAVFSNDNNTFGGGSFRELCSLRSIPFYSSIEHLKEVKKPIEYLISVQFHEILKKEHLNRVKERAVNLHMAPVPEYRGCNQFSFAIYNQDLSFGTTLHIMDEGIDSGDIIAERRFNISSEISVEELLNKTIEESKILFEKNLMRIFDAEFSPKKQRGKKRIYYRKDIKKLKEINLSDSEEEVDLKMRASFMPGFDPPHIIIKGKKYYLIPEKSYSK